MISDTLALDPDGTLKPKLVERRAYPRFALSLAGTCAIDGGDDVVCTALDVSLGGLALRSRATALVDRPVSVSLPQIGLVHGRVVRRWADGFALRFDDSAAQQRRVATYLIWLVARDTRPEDRRAERIVPLRRLVALSTQAGTFMARIIDISRSGIAVTTTAIVAEGELVRFDDTTATVTRLFEGGLAAQFVDEIAGTFDASVRL